MMEKRYIKMLGGINKYIKQGNVSFFAPCSAGGVC